MAMHRLVIKESPGLHTASQLSSSNGLTFGSGDTLVPSKVFPIRLCASDIKNNKLCRREITIGCRGGSCWPVICQQKAAHKSVIAGVLRTKGMGAHKNVIVCTHKSVTGWPLARAGALVLHA